MNRPALAVLAAMVAQSLFSVWVRQDPAGAVAGANQIANVRLRKQSGFQILNAIARTDPGMLDAVAIDEQTRERLCQRRF